MSVNVHFIMQGKGGVGKTLISTVMTQFYRNMDRRVLCIDTDPVNNSFSKFSALNVESIPLMKDGDFDQRNFDLMTEKILGADTDEIIIDSGASTFVPLVQYINQCGLIEILFSSDRKPVIHSVVTGGQSSDDTLLGLGSLLGNFKEMGGTPPLFAVWLNPFFGALEWKGKSFKELPVYEKFSDIISFVVEMPLFKPALFGADLQQMLNGGLTFEQVQQDSSFMLMAKHRIHKVQQQLFDSIAAAELNNV